LKAKSHSSPALPGASATVAMTHIAIQEALNGKVVEWMKKVSDDQHAVLPS